MPSTHTLLQNKSQYISTGHSWILTLFAQLTYVNVLHWIIGIYYYGFLDNEGIGLILVIRTLYPSAHSVLYNKDVYPTSSIV